MDAALDAPDAGRLGHNGLLGEMNIYMRVERKIKFGRVQNGLLSIVDIGCYDIRLWGFSGLLARVGDN